MGHLFELLSPEEVYLKYKAWTLEVLPILPNGDFQIKPKKGQSGPDPGDQEAARSRRRGDRRKRLRRRS